VKKCGVRRRLSFHDLASPGLPFALAGVLIALPGLQSAKPTPSDAVTVDALWLTGFAVFAVNIRQTLRRPTEGS